MLPSSPGNKRNRRGCLATIKRRTHQRSSEEIIDLGNKCIVMQKEQGFTLHDCAVRYGVSDNAVRRWITNVKLAHSKSDK